MSFLKLTTARTKSPIRVRSRAIQAFWTDGAGSTKVIIGYESVSICESLDELDAKIAECEHVKTSRQSGMRISAELVSAEEMTTLAKQLLGYRRSMGFTGANVAKDSGFKKSMIYDIESAASGKARRKVSRKTFSVVAAWVQGITEQFIREGGSGSPTNVGCYCCLLHGTQYVRRWWDGSQWTKFESDDDANRTIIGWQYLGRHVR
jgi:hypothetical protein